MMHLQVLLLWRRGVSHREGCSRQQVGGRSDACAGCTRARPGLPSTLDHTSRGRWLRPSKVQRHCSKRKLNSVAGLVAGLGWRWIRTRLVYSQ